MTERKQRVKNNPILAHIWIPFKVTSKDKFQGNFRSICLSKKIFYLLQKLILSAKAIKIIRISTLQILPSFQKHQRKWKNACFPSNFLNTDANKCHFHLSSCKSFSINADNKVKKNLNKRLGFHTHLTNVFNPGSKILHIFIPKRRLTSFYFLII